jgi:hypothetical protein
MAIFYTDTGSLNRLEVSGSVLISGSGNSILSISGSSGGLLEVSDLTAEANVFQITSASIDIFTIHSNKKVAITGSLIATEGITGSLFGTASQATSASYSLTASFALNAGGGGGSGFPFAGTALITGSIVLTSGSGFPSLLASETLTAGDLVNIFSGGVRRASNDDLTKQAHGFVTQSRAATNPVVVFYSGLNTNVTGLTAGARYFLSTAGSEATTPPTATARLSQEVGVAVSTTALLVNFGPAIIT